MKPFRQPRPNPAKRRIVKRMRDAGPVWLWLQPPTAHQRRVVVLPGIDMVRWPDLS